MAERRGKLETVRLSTPVTAEAIAGLELGQVVYLDGVVYTAREGVYRRVLDEGVAPPLDLKSLLSRFGVFWQRAIRKRKSAKRFVFFDHVHDSARVEHP